MFSELTLARLEAPRPPEPMTAMLSRVFAFWARKKFGAARTAAAAAERRRKPRRVGEECFMGGASRGVKRTAPIGPRASPALQGPNYRMVRGDGSALRPQADQQV